MSYKEVKTFEILIIRHVKQFVNKNLQATSIHNFCTKKKKTELG